MKEIGYAKSLMDYIFRWLALKFLSGEEMAVADMSGAGEGGHAVAPDAILVPPVDLALAGHNGDGPPCQQCGTIMVRNGTCYRCLNCGSTSGCS